MKKLYAADWGNGDGTVFVTKNEKGNIIKYKQEGGIESFLNSHTDVLLAVELTFESREVDKYNKILSLAQERNIQLLSVQPRMTGNWRSRLGGGSSGETKTTDLADAKIIFMIAESKLENNKPFKEFSLREMKKGGWYEKFDGLRKQGYPEEKIRSLMANLPSLQTAPDYVQEVLSDGKDYSISNTLPFVMAANELLKEGGDRDAFIRLCGAYEYGYPSFLRSTYYRRVKTLEQRKLKELGLISGNKGDKVTQFLRRDEPAWWPVHKEVMKKTQKSFRWLFQQVKAQGNGERFNPVT